MPTRFRGRRPGGVDVPPITLRLMVATGLTTLLCVISANLGHEEVLEEFLLRPYQVIPGLRLWKLLSYLLVIDLSPINFLIGLVVLYFFGAWFERMWGGRRFLVFYVASGAGAAVFTVLVGLVSKSVAHTPYFGIWPIMEALTVALGILEPNSEVYFYFLLPVKARLLMFLSWGLIVLFMIFSGSPVPYVAAAGGVVMGLLLTVGRGGPRRAWLRLRGAWLERQARRRSRHLSVVPPRDGPKEWLN
ncbi:MAG: rhomboid family intramembrane serine protease [Deltaproteobacteria bacterium]